MCSALTPCLRFSVVNPLPPSSPLPSVRTGPEPSVTDPAYLAAVRMLARRELSEAQVRQRLRRLGHSSASIDASITRLKDECSLNDVRVAGALARTLVGVQKRGRARVRQQLAAAGLSEEIADRAIAAAFEDVDEDALLRSRIEQRLGARDAPLDTRERARLYRYLLRQGFAHAQIMAALRDLSD
jgi:regulatory protein